MPRLSLWKEGTHSADYKFQDRRIKELLTASGLGINVHKFLGVPAGDGTSDDATQPSYINPTELSIQDLLFLENRDRKYDTDVYSIRGHYTPQDIDFNLSQFGLFISNDTLFITFHINDMIDRMGRKIMAGDVLELPNVRDYNPLDPNDVIPAALKKYYVVEEANRAAEGFAPTWWPHLWRVKVKPMVNSQEYKDIIDSDENSSIKDYLSSYEKNIAINDAIVDQAEAEVPESGYDTTSLYTMPTDDHGNPAVNDSFTSDTTFAKTDATDIRADATPISPKRGPLGYLVGDGFAPNGWPVKPLTYFPDNASEGEFVLRLDFYPNRLFRFNGRKWVRVEEDQRAMLTGSANETQLGTFVNNTNTTVTQRGEFLDERVSLSQVLKPRADQ